MFTGRGIAVPVNIVFLQVKKGFPKFLKFSWNNSPGLQ